MSNLTDPNNLQQQEPEKDWTETSRRVKSALAVLVSFAVIIAGGWWAAGTVGEILGSVVSGDDYQGPGEGEVEVIIPPGTTLDEIGSILHDAEVVASTWAFDQAARENPESTKVQAGTYVLKKRMRAADALQAMLDSGIKGGKKFLIREGLRLGEQVTELSKQTDIPEEAYREALTKPDVYGLPDYAKGNPEGFLFPDTYEMSGSDPNAALKQMTANFKRKANEVQLEARAQDMNRTPLELLTVASIIEAEVRRPEDRPKVARVLYNRLESNPPMKLQLDTTVEYAVNKPRGTGATTTDAERANPSPYNTYVHDGLPPGPISGPGKSAMEAAANPAEGTWKFFVAINLDTGETAFADTFAEHQENVKKFQAWCQANPGKC